MKYEEPWWPPKDIRFTNDQIIWLISALPLLREGQWPKDPRQADRRDSSSQKRRRQGGAAFETPAMIAAEIDIRIKACGQDGWLLKAVWAWGETHQSLGISQDELKRRTEQSLRFVAGWKRKKMPYLLWARQTRYLAAHTTPGVALAEQAKRA